MSSNIVEVVRIKDPDWDNRWQLRVFRDIPPEYIRRRRGG